MFVLERTYDPAELVRHNLHTHSVFSLCAKKEMTLEAMIRRAEEEGLRTLAVTDHSDPGDDIDTYANFLTYKERLRRMETPVRVLIGLIPNCAASVVIAQMYLEGLLTCGQLMSGLLVGAGVGLLVLFRTNTHHRENIAITAVLLGLGICWGVLIDILGITF